MFAGLADGRYVYLPLKGLYALLEIGVLLDDESILDLQLLLTFY